MTRIAPYGSWRSPITADLLVSGAAVVSQPALDGGDLYWIESRPQEGGRNVIVRRGADGRTIDVTPPEFNARTRLHEYGGGDFVVADGTLYFSNFADQRLYAQRVDAAPEALTRGANRRYADGAVDRRRGRLFVVREEHAVGGREPSNTLACVSLEGDGDERVVVAGNDFYSSPRVSPDGALLAWLTWNHPNMPWDGTELWVGKINDDGTVADAGRVAGGARESVLQPEWSPGGELYFASDKAGWWNLYRLRAGRAEPLCEMAAEFAAPQSSLGMTTYAFESADRIVCAYHSRGRAHLAALDLESGRLDTIQTPYTDISYLRATAGRAVFRGGSEREPAGLVEFEFASGRARVLRAPGGVSIDDGYLSTPRAVEFPTSEGKTAHAFFYPPRNLDYQPPEGERPPLLVKCHGGPTAAVSATLNLRNQYWTSRGVAVLDVNYGGSTGYGREYRQRLDGRWGVVDVDDCVNGARHLIESGEVDGRRCAISGSSAGGYTALCALAFRDLFRAGASHYGVSDLEVLAKGMHKFESHYLDRLIGPYPERADLYRERSPLHAADRISCDVIFFQGLEDRVVLPEQSELMVGALRANGRRVAYVTFEGEQHGFRRAESIKQAVEDELYFYSRAFGFEVAEPPRPVPEWDGEAG